MEIFPQFLLFWFSRIGRVWTQQQDDGETEIGERWVRGAAVARSSVAALWGGENQLSEVDRK